MPKLYLLFVVFISSVSVFASDEQQGNECGNNKEAIALVELIKADKGQKRQSIRCNKILTQAAASKAEKMAEFGMVVHNLGGSPNSHLENAGYKLPKHYGSQFNSNQVEAIAGGYSDAKSVWKAFKRSDGHRTHLLGDHEFYLEQDEIGVGFVKKWSSPHVEYWVVYLTKGFSPNQQYLGDKTKIPNKNFSIIQNDKK